MEPLEEVLAVMEEWLPIQLSVHSLLDMRVAVEEEDWISAPMQEEEEVEVPEVQAKQRSVSAGQGEFPLPRPTELEVKESLARSEVPRQPMRKMAEQVAAVLSQGVASDQVVALL